MSNLIPSIFVTYAHNTSVGKWNELGMRPMQEYVYQKRGEQYPLILNPYLYQKGYQQHE